MEILQGRRGKANIGISWSAVEHMFRKPISTLPQRLYALVVGVPCQQKSLWNHQKVNNQTQI